MSPTSVETTHEPAALDKLQTSLRPLAPAIRKVWTMKLLLLTGVLTLGALVYDVVHLFQADRTLPPGAVTVLVLALGGALSYGLPRLRYRFWRFALHPEELYLERGIFNRVHTIVPLRRIQHLDVSQDLFEREYNLGKLIVHTAGTRSSDVVLPGLEYEEAERLRDAVKAYVLEDAL